MTDPAAVALLEDLRGRLDGAVRAALGGLGVLDGGGGAVGLLNFPNHANAGDSAVWLGAEACLGRLGVRVGHRASPASYDPVAVRAAIGDGPVLLGGGGNLGDVYRRQQEVRERVLVDFADRPVVQLPQSIWFRDPARRDAFADQVARHSRFTLLVRDEPSRTQGERLGAATVTLCPDLAFGLGPLARRGDPTVDVVWLTRSDPEAVEGSGIGDGGGLASGSDRSLRVVDWLDPSVAPVAPDVPARVAELVDGRFGDLSGHGPASRRLRHRVLGWAFDRRARFWLARGLAVLSSGRVVVTERLHGHLLCLLAGIPHVVLDSRTHKIGATGAAWTRSSPLARWADDPAHAWALAEELSSCD